MDSGAGEGIDEGDRFVRDGLEFVPSWSRRSVPGSLTLLKNIGMVAAYERLLEPHPNPRMVELGISQGGSVALLALMSKPERFVAVDIDEEPVLPLLDALKELGLDQTVKPYFGVDQADRTRLVEILDDQFGEAPLDVVIDDASHVYDPTLASFEVLFPRLRTGGVYVIEDWTCDDLRAKGAAAALEDTTSPRREVLLRNLGDRMEAILADPTSPEHARLQEVLERHLRSESDAPGPAAPTGGAIDPSDGNHNLTVGAQRQSYAPLSRLALELTLARAHSAGVIADVHLDENWITVHRGPTAVDQDDFRLVDLYPDPYQQLATRRTL